MCCFFDLPLLQHPFISENTFLLRAQSHRNPGSTCYPRLPLHHKGWLCVLRPSPGVSEAPRSLSSPSCANSIRTAPWSQWLSLALLGPMPAAPHLACPLGVHQQEQASVRLCLQGQAPSG